MKTLISLVLALCLVLGMASAVAEGLKVGTFDVAGAGEVEVNCAWWGNQLRDEVTKNTLDFFTENYPNITFNLNAQNWNNYWSIMKTAAGDGSLPDLMQQDYAFLEQWVESGDLLERHSAEHRGHRQGWRRSVCAVRRRERPRHAV